MTADDFERELARREAEQHAKMIKKLEAERDAIQRRIDFLSEEVRALNAKARAGQPA